MSEPNRELADFLRRARAQIDPVRAGLPADDRVRRVPGLRREEVARLAGVSADYYTRLEQGRRITPTVGVVDAIARALDLDAAGREYLGQLIGRPSTTARRSVPVPRVRPGMHQLLDSLDGVPALVLGRRSDVLASNWMADALFADFAALPARERNYVRWMFLGSEPRELFLDWETQARAAVESLRLDVGNNPEDRAGLALVEELSVASAEFRQWWVEHRVLQRTHGSKRLRHPVAGELTVEYETLTLPGDSDQTVYLYTTEPGSPSRQALRMLASWSVPDPQQSRGSQGTQRGSVRPDR